MAINETVKDFNAQIEFLMKPRGLQVQEKLDRQIGILMETPSSCQAANPTEITNPIEYLARNAKKFRRYAGQWIAIEGSEILDYGSDEVKLEIRLRKKGFKAPLLVRIPSKSDIPFAGSNVR